MRKTFLSILFAAVICNLSYSKSKVDLAKSNGIKVVLDDSDSEYNTYMKKAITDYWTFSDYEFITRSTYEGFTGNEKDYVIGLMEITMTINGNYTWCENSKFIACLDKHKHISRKNNRIEMTDIVAYDFIPDGYSSGTKLEALINSIIREQNHYFTALYNGSKAKTQAVDYKTLKSKIASDKTTPIYMLEENLVTGADYLQKLGNTNVEIVSEEKLISALVNGENVLVYIYQDFNEGHSIKKLVHAKTGEVFFNITNGKSNDKATLKDILKIVS